MGKWNVYIAPIKDDGTFYDYISVSKYCVNQNVGSITIKSEMNEFDIGIAPTSNYTLRLNNSEGQFSAAGENNSIFPYKRKGSKVKLTYLFGENEPICGVAIAGVDVLGPEKVVFEGLLTEKNLEQDILTYEISFTVLGKESIFEDYETDISGLSSSDTIAQTIYKLLNTTDITNVLSLDSGNINPAINSVLSNVNSDTSLAYLDNTTIKEALDILLQMSASVLYIRDNEDVYVTDRSVNDPSFQYYFYGQAANFGIENMQNVDSFKSGHNRMFNYWKWKDTSLTSKELTSISDNGLYKHDDIDLDFVDQTTARQNLLDEYKTSYSNPKRELTLATFINVNVLGLSLFDKVSIDYPNVPIPAGNGNLPIWNSATMVWREESTFDPTQPFFTWPDGLFNLEIDPSEEWKIIGIIIDSKSDLIKYNLREV